MKSFSRNLYRRAGSVLAILALLVQLVPLSSVSAATWTRTGVQLDKFAGFSDYRDTLDGVPNQKVLVIDELSRADLQVAGTSCSVSGNTLTWGAPQNTISSFQGRTVTLQGYRVQEFYNYSFDQDDSNTIRDFYAGLNNRTLNVEQGSASGNQRYYRIMPVYKLTAGDAFYDALYFTATYTGGCELSRQPEPPTSVTAKKSGTNLEVTIGVPNGQTPGGALLEFHPGGDANTVLFAAAYSVGGLSPLKVQNGVIKIVIPMDQLTGPSSSTGLAGTKVGSSNNGVGDDAMFNIESAKSYRIYASIGSYARSRALLDNKSGFVSSGDLAAGAGTGTNGGTTTNPPTSTMTTATALSATKPFKTNGRLVKLEVVGGNLYPSFEDKGFWASDEKNGYFIELYQAGQKIATDTVKVDLGLDVSETIPYGGGKVRTSPTANTFAEIAPGKFYEIRILRAYDGNSIINNNDFLSQTFTGANGTVFADGAGTFTNPTGGLVLTPTNNIDAPQHLSVLKADGTSVNLSWDTINCGAMNTLTYIIRANGQEKSKFVANSAMSVPRTENSVTDLTPITNYTFEVEAQCKETSTGNIVSKKSTIVGTTTVDIPVQSNNIQEIGNLHVVERDYKSIKIAWDTVQCGSFNGLTYIVRRNGTQVNSFTTNSASPTATYSTIVDSLEANKSYTLELEAQCKSASDNSVVSKKASITGTTTAYGAIQLTATVSPIKGAQNRYAVVLKRLNDHPAMPESEKNVWFVPSKQSEKTYTKSGTNLEVSNTSKTCGNDECSTNPYDFYICMTDSYTADGKPDFYSNQPVYPLYVFDRREAVILDMQSSVNPAGNKYTVAVVGLPGGGPQNCFNDVIKSTDSRFVNSNLAEFTIPAAEDTQAPVFTSSELGVTSPQASGNYMGGSTFGISFNVQEPNLQSCEVTNGLETKSITCTNGSNTANVSFATMPVDQATIKVTAKDKGNRTASLSKTIQLDQTAPQVQATFPTTFTTGSTIAISCSDSQSGCSKLEYTTGTINGQCSLVENGWTSVPEAQLGSYTVSNVESGAAHICVRSEDKVGNKNPGTRYVIPRVAAAPVQTAFVAPVITGGTPLALSGDQSPTINLGVTFTTGKDVFYTITEGTESQQYPYTGSIYLTEGTHTNFYINFYDEKGNKIGNAFGPYTVTVKVAGASLTMPTSVYRTKDATFALPITSITSTGESVSYTVELNGVSKLNGMRVKAEYGTAFTTESITLEPNKVNELFVKLHDANGKDSTFKRTVIQDNQGPTVSAPQGVVVDNTKIRWSFAVTDQNQGTVKEVMVQPRNATTGDVGTAAAATKNADGTYTYEMAGLPVRAGHEYILKITSKDDLDNAAEYTMANPVVKQKGYIDTIDMLQKMVSIDPTIITSDNIKVTISNNTISYTASILRGKSVVFADVLTKGGNERDYNTKLTKLPVGTYKMTIDTIGLASNKTQTVNSFVVEPYYADAAGDLNGDGHVGATDRYLFDLGRAQGKYQGATSDVTTLVSTIDTALQSSLLQNVDNYLRY